MEETKNNEGFWGRFAAWLSGKNKKLKEENKYLKEENSVLIFELAWVRGRQKELTEELNNHTSSFSIG